MVKFRNRTPRPRSVRWLTGLRNGLIIIGIPRRLNRPRIAVQPSADRFRFFDLGKGKDLEPSSNASRNFLQGLTGASAPNRVQYYQVNCPEGHRLRGERTEGYQGASLSHLRRRDVCPAAGVPSLVSVPPASVDVRPEVACQSRALLLGRRPGPVDRSRLFPSPNR